MTKSKKIIASLGTVLIVASPLIGVISCGKPTNNDSMNGRLDKSNYKKLSTFKSGVLTINKSVKRITGVVFADGYPDPAKPGSFLKITKLILNQGLTEIADQAFESSDQLTTLIIPDSVTSIGDETFKVSPLTKLKLSNNLDSIGIDTFASAVLTTLNIPDSVTSIGNSAFYRSPLGVSGLSLSNKLEKIGSSAFNSATLTNLLLPDSLSSIGVTAFENSQLTSLIIPSNVQSIGEDAFSTSTLQSLTFKGDVAGTNSRTLTLEEHAFANTLITSINGDNTQKTTAWRTWANLQPQRKAFNPAFIAYN